MSARDLRLQQRVAEAGAGAAAHADAFDALGGALPGPGAAAAAAGGSAAPGAARDGLSADAIAAAISAAARAAGIAGKTVPQLRAAESAETRERLEARPRLPAFALLRPLPLAGCGSLACRF